MAVMFHKTIFLTLIILKLNIVCIILLFLHLVLSQMLLPCLKLQKKLFKTTVSDVTFSKLQKLSMMAGLIIIKKIVQQEPVGLVIKKYLMVVYTAYPQ